mmetsp:Transcript_71565/g.190881  ORF Transcript_71565/g.190881 Transcript_71565/m.190881 type:complete len:326 (+) Transcript_71565:377-1354(+)
MTLQSSAPDPTLPAAANGSNLVVLAFWHCDWPERHPAEDPCAEILAHDDNRVLAGSLLSSSLARTLDWSPDLRQHVVDSFRGLGRARARYDADGDGYVVSVRFDSAGVSFVAVSGVALRPVSQATALGILLRRSAARQHELAVQMQHCLQRTCELRNAVCAASEDLSSAPAHHTAAHARICAACMRALNEQKRHLCARLAGLEAQGKRCPALESSSEWRCAALNSAAVSQLLESAPAVVPKPAQSHRTGNQPTVFPSLSPMPSAPGPSIIDQSWGASLAMPAVSWGGDTLTFAWADFPQREAPGDGKRQKVDPKVEQEVKSERPR